MVSRAWNKGGAGHNEHIANHIEAERHEDNRELSRNGHRHGFQAVHGGTHDPQDRGLPHKAVVHPHGNEEQDGRTLVRERLRIQVPAEHFHGQGRKDPMGCAGLYLARTHICELPKGGEVQIHDQKRRDFYRKPGEDVGPQPFVFNCKTTHDTSE